jgi:tetratricopeptide (TPR) repeat protein
MNHTRSLWTISSTLILLGGTVLPLPLLAQGTPAVPTVAQTESVPDPELETLAKQATVRVTTGNNQGSGTLLAKQKDTYLVITNRHVVQNVQTIQIQTFDGQKHPATLIENGFQDQSDLALLEFTSTTDYPLPTLSSATPGQGLREGLNIISAGYATESGQFQVQTSQLKTVLTRPLQAGYQVGYGGTIQQGMSGGPVFVDGDLIGINGLMAFPILPRYQYEDGSQPTATEQEQLRQLNWGVPIQRALQQVQPELLIAYDLPLPSGQISRPSTTVGFVADLEAKAKQFTVKIESSKGFHGTGVIIAKRGKVYTVLTANHVVCERDNETLPCQSQTYTVMTPDGQKIPVSPQAIQRPQSVDVAVLEFESDVSYSIATLGNYNPQANAAVFVAGFPNLSQTGTWQFNGGYILERNLGTLKVRNYRLGKSNQDSDQAQATFSGGYEFVYTSITYKGMSGGPILDSQGQVIGLHGAAEGEYDDNDLEIQLGYSLGIPTNTILATMAQLKMNPNALQISTTKAPPLVNEQIIDLEASVLYDVPLSNATAQIWIERGNQLYRLGRYWEATGAFEEAIRQKPKFAYLAWFGKGLALWFLDNRSEAISALEMAAQENPSDAGIYKFLTSAYRQDKQYENALKTVEQAIKLQPDDAQILNEKFWVLLDLNRDQEALDIINQVIHLSPRAVFYVSRGLTYHDLKRYEEALAEYDQAIALDPNFVNAYNNRGLVYRDLKRYEEALAEYNQAIALDPNFVNAYNNRGNVYRDQKRYEEALAEYNQAIALDPNFVYAYLGRGDVFNIQKRYEEALVEYNQAIAIDSNIANAHVGMAVFTFFRNVMKKHLWSSIRRLPLTKIIYMPRLVAGMSSIFRNVMKKRLWNSIMHSHLILKTL